MRRRVIAVVVPFCTVLALFAQPARAGVIEQVKAEATGIAPATVIVTVKDPATETGLLRLCLTFKTSGKQVCIVV